VGPTPSYLDYNNVTSKIYVANTQNSSIAVINATDNTIIKDIDLKGMLPSKLVVNPGSNKIYVANSGSDMLSIVDGENDSLLKNETFPFIVSDIAINPNTNKIYAIGDNNDSLSIVDGKRDLVTKNEKLSFIPSAIAINQVTNKVYIANYYDWSILVLDGSSENVTDNVNATIPLNIPPESITIDEKTNRVYVGSYVREDISEEDDNVKPLSVAFPPRTQIQIIDGNNNKVLYNTTLKLDPKYGAVILASNPMNSDTLAVPLVTDTILSWNMKQAEEAINTYNGILDNITEVNAGADPAQIAFNINDGKIYIANYRLNAVMVEDLEKFKAP
jgi:DNA-binding beta-propeller fold protein YncE